ncbi:hypothetical protein D9M68_486360 [compost metagenome]
MRDLVGEVRVFVPVERQLHDLAAKNRYQQIPLQGNVGDDYAILLERRYDHVLNHAVALSRTGVAEVAVNHERFPTNGSQDHT